MSRGLERAAMDDKVIPPEHLHLSEVGDSRGEVGADHFSVNPWAGLPALNKTREHTCTLGLRKKLHSLTCLLGRAAPGFS